MKIYKLSQNVNNDYETYDSAVVVAEDEESAKRIHPCSVWAEGGFYDEEKKEFWTMSRPAAGGKGGPYLFEGHYYGSWINDLTKIEVEYLGEAEEDKEKGVVCASYNAG